ncbi:type IX secretion system protein PorD [Parvicella tangerina]|uniref:DUF4835 family protein n=1 Tax=Parvicella tangerina TaxID=2829795 RepID=A0A916JM93_9FLAO|nr:DUF4835 family protein [Parvicella tangerina]CAG5081202.1 hypothetical protein CRYO30217_01562 [Parvicella tangerina]
MRKAFGLFIFMCSLTFVKAQEINCDVSVIAPTLASSPANTEIMEALKNSVYEFVNSKQWTDDVFAEEEKIDMSILINIKTYSSSSFTASIQISSSRPVYNSDYQTRLFNFNDEKFNFTYNRGEALIFTQDRHVSNLSDVVAYYVYMVLGYDYDSFSLKGGTKYFMKAQQIVGRCQNASEPGWKPTDGKKNRFTLVDNALNNAFLNLRKCYYNYHREGFDQLYSNNKEAVEEVINSLNLLQQIHKIQPNSINVQIFFTAKADEIVAMFKDTVSKVKRVIVRFLERVIVGIISIECIMRG